MRVSALLLVVLVSLASSSAYAATLNVVSGQLVGASGVDIGGTLYDVEFVDGTCAELFNGCDESSDFTFAFYPDAESASLALLAQVFVGVYDASPMLTRGCGLETHCTLLTPFEAPSSFMNNTPYLHVDMAGVRNSSDGLSQTINLQSWHNTGDTTPESYMAWAVWSATPVPEPSTALLMGLGLAGLARRRR